MSGTLSKEQTPPAVAPTTRIIVAQLNARLQPVHRVELFEDPLDEALQSLGVGTITGGGTLQSESGEVTYCDIEITVAAYDKKVVQTIITCLEQLGAPRGSRLRVGAEQREVPFGITEGMAIYLNGTDLPEEVYKKYDSNVVYDEIERLLSDCGEIYSYWQGATETALYLYGNSFNEMHASVSAFLASYPLCQQCRIQQIA